MKNEATIGDDQLADLLTPETTLLSLDVESNGLHGPAFAVGALVMKLDGTVVDEFAARSPIKGEVDPWVKKYVLPPMAEFAETHKTAKAMRTAFWDWFKAVKEKADYVMVDQGYPVEARFLLSCQDDDIEGRYWEHAYPQLDLASMLIQVGIRPNAVRYRLVEDQLDGSIKHHNPSFDAKVSALTAILAFKRAGRLAED